MRVYLCGGINGLSDDEATNWRDATTRLLNSLGHSTIDPMRRDYRGREDENVNEIIAGDLQDIDNADALIVNATRPSWGTAMEVFYAYNYSSNGQAVVVVHPEGEPVSPWLRAHSDKIVYKFTDAIAYLVGVSSF